MRLRPYLLLFVAILTSFVLCGDAGAAGKTFAGKRIIFEEGVLHWGSKEATDQLLVKIKGAGFNAFGPIVWHGRGSMWPSTYAEWDFWLNAYPKQDYDPLKYLIDQAHAMGIEIHPWFNLALREGDFLPQFAPCGTPKGAFDVHMPEFRHLMANLVAEVVSRYDVDGINLDIVRTRGLCTSDFCQADYEKRYGRNLLLDTAQFKATFGRVPTLVEYQESDVTAMVLEISQRVRAIKPNIVISADVIPLIASTDEGQNSIDWENKGLVDVLFRMAYNLDVDIALTDKIRGLLKNPDSLTLVISNLSHEEKSPTQAHFSRNGKWFADTITTIQQRWPMTGVGVYMYRWLSDEQIAAVKSGPFKPPTPPLGLGVK
jgi:Glycosyl hydrolase-like 10